MKSKQMYNRAYCLSPAKVNDEGLIEIAKIKAINKIKSFPIKNSREEDSILTNVPINTNFFYSIQNLNENFDITYSEKGIAELIPNDGRTILDRQYVFNRWDEDEQREMVLRDGTPEQIPIEGWFILSTYTPDHYSQLFISEHAVLCSIDQGTPATVPLEEATLLGRLDNRIQSIDSDELVFILGDKIKGALESSEGNLHLSVKELSLNGRNSIIMTDQIQLRPKKQRPRRFSVGSLYYNEKKKTFEFHDGQNWKTIVTD